MKSPLFSQPHRPFFLLGILNAVLFMLLFRLAYIGALGIDAKLLHAYSMFFLVFTNFFYGFTYTTFPRFCATAPIDSRRYLRVWFLQVLATLSFLAALWLPFAFYATVLFVATSLAYTLRIFLGIYRRASASREDPYWIIVAYGMGALANLLFLLAEIPCTHCRTGIFFEYAVSVGFYLYLIFLPTVVAFRMVPLFSRVMEYRKSPWLLQAVFGLLLLHLLVGGYAPRWLFGVDMILAGVLGWEILRIELPFPNRDPLLWGLHLAIFWLPLGFFLGALSELAGAWFSVPMLRLPLHLLALGFLTTILVAFGARVTLGHGGASLRSGRGSSLLFASTQLVLLGRLILSLAVGSGAFFLFFDLSVALWIALFLFWSVLYGRILLFGARGREE